MVKSYKPQFVKKGHGDEKGKRKPFIEPITKYMATDLITFRPDTEIITVIETLLQQKISGAPVLNDKNEVIGVIDDKDCMRVLIDSVFNNQPVSNFKVEMYMSNVYKTIRVDADVLDVANEFLKSAFKRLLVVDEKGRLVGQVSRRDILNAIKIMNITTWHKT